MCSVSRREAGARPMCPVSRHRAAAVVTTFTGSHQQQPELSAMTRSLITNNNNSTTAHSMMDGVSNSHSINRWINELMDRDSNCDKINVVKWPSGLWWFVWWSWWCFNVCYDREKCNNCTAKCNHTAIKTCCALHLCNYSLLHSNRSSFSSLLKSFFKYFIGNWQWLEVSQADILDHTYNSHHMLSARYISHVTSPSGSGQCHVPLNKYSDKPENIQFGRKVLFHLSGYRPICNAILLLPIYATVPVLPFMWSLKLNKIKVEHGK